MNTGGFIFERPFVRDIVAGGPIDNRLADGIIEDIVIDYVAPVREVSHHEIMSYVQEKTEIFQLKDLNRRVGNTLHALGFCRAGRRMWRLYDW